jgi:hypothetical protein
MATSPRNRRALIIFGVVVAVAAAAFFLIPKATKKSAQSPGPVVGPTVSPVPSASPTPKPKTSPKQVLIFSGRDPFDPSQGGGSITPVSATSPVPGSTTASAAVFLLAELLQVARRRGRKGASRARKDSLPEVVTSLGESPGS